MAEGEQARLVAWGDELRAVHARLRAALRMTIAAIAAGHEPGQPTRDLLVFCHSFCSALTAHHRGESTELFPTLVQTHPELRATLQKLEQDHVMIADLVAALQSASEHGGSPAQLERHLHGIAAIMESHFRYEERQLLTVLDTLSLEADPREVLGPACADPTH